MPTRGHSTAPYFDGNALNLRLYFDEVESLSINTGLNKEGKICHTLRYASREDNELWSMLPEAEAVRGTPLDLSSFLFLTPFSLYSYSLILPVYIFTGS
jgi:hypothetical protein